MKTNKENKKKKIKQQKTASKKEMAFAGGGEQGSRTPSAERRTFHVSNGGAPASALLSSGSRRQNDYNTILQPEQNKNAIIGNDDVFTGPLVDEVPPSDTYLYNSTSKNSVKPEVEKNVGDGILGNVLEIVCIYCGSKDFVKRGRRKKKMETVQLYLCRACNRAFTPRAIKGKHYPLAIILNAISLYNLGYSLERVAKEITKMLFGKESQQKTTSINEMAFDASTGARSELVNSDSSIADVKYLSSDDKNSSRAVEIGGVEPPRLELTSSASQPAIPTALEEFLELISAECPHQYFQDGLFEFYPLHAVYKPNRKRKKVQTIEGVYAINERVDKIESLRPLKHDKGPPKTPT